MSTHSSNTPDGHDASDQKLDEQAFAEREQRASRSSPTYDPAEIRKHDDTGRDRLFEDRQQHDEAEKNSEKNRLARDESIRLLEVRPLDDSLESLFRELVR